MRPSARHRKLKVPPEGVPDNQASASHVRLLPGFDLPRYYGSVPGTGNTNHYVVSYPASRACRMGHLLESVRPTSLQYHNKQVGHITDQP